MEMIAAGAHTVFTMEDMSRVGEARRYAAAHAGDMEFNDVDAGKLAIVVTELATNLVRHATNGRLLVCVDAKRREIELVCIDDGPGIADVRRSMGDGFSTGGTPGTGLGAVRRLADDYDMHSSVPAGTVAVARLRPSGCPKRPTSFAVGAISVAAPGETECGDSWAFAIDGPQITGVVADGLGHGPHAAAASRDAIDEFGHRAAATTTDILQAFHRRLRSTRGCAVAILRADAHRSSLELTGAGNVMTRIVSGSADRMLLTQNGTAGVQMRTPSAVTADWPAHALVVMFSDGIASRWPGQLLHQVLQRDPSLAAAIVLRDHLRGRDDASVTVFRRGAA